MFDPLKAILDPALFQQYMQDPKVGPNESFEQWKERCRPMPTNPATLLQTGRLEEKDHD